jgi:hypothetical protein
MPKPLSDKQSKLLKIKKLAIRRFRRLNKDGMDPITRAVLRSYLDHMNPRMGNLAWVSQTTLADDLGYERRTIMRAVEILKQIGALTLIASNANKVREILYERFRYQLRTEAVSLNLITLNTKWEGFKQGATGLSTQTKDQIKALRQKRSRHHVLLEKLAAEQEAGWATPFVVAQAPLEDYTDEDPDVVAQAPPEGMSDEEVDAILDTHDAMVEAQTVVAQAPLEGYSDEESPGEDHRCGAGATGTLSRERGWSRTWERLSTGPPVQPSEEENLKPASVHGARLAASSERGFDACGVSPPQALKLSLAGSDPQPEEVQPPAQRKPRFDLGKLKANLTRSFRTANTQSEPRPCPVLGLRRLCPA